MSSTHRPALPKEAALEARCLLSFCTQKPEIREAPTSGQVLCPLVGTGRGHFPDRSPHLAQTSPAHPETTAASIVGSAAVHKPDPGQQRGAAQRPTSHIRAPGECRPRLPSSTRLMWALGGSRDGPPAWETQAAPPPRLWSGGSCCRLCGVKHWLEQALTLSLTHSVSQIKNK